MAKLLIHSSPVTNDSTNVSIKEGDTLRKALLTHGQGLDQSPLAVSVNGHFPDDLSLDYPIKRNDFIHVYRADLQGSQGDSSNKIFGTIALIAAVALTIVSAGAASPLIAVAAGIGAVGLNVLGSYLISRSRAVPGQETRAEVDAAANVFNITAATNENRLMQPMRVLMGCHRFAPDYATAPYIFYSPNGLNTDGGDTGENLAVGVGVNYGGAMPELFTGTNAFVNSNPVYQETFVIPGVTSQFGQPQTVNIQLNTGSYNTLRNVNVSSGFVPGAFTGGGTVPVIYPYYSNNITAVNETSLDATGENWEIISNQLIGTASTPFSLTQNNWDDFGTLSGTPATFEFPFHTGDGFDDNLLIRRRVYIPRDDYNNIVFNNGIPASTIMSSRFFDINNFNSANTNTYPFLIDTTNGDYTTIPVIVVNEIILRGTSDVHTNLGWIDVIDNIIYGETVNAIGSNLIGSHVVPDGVRHNSEITSNGIVPDFEQVTLYTGDGTNRWGVGTGNITNAITSYKSLGQSGNFSVTSASFTENGATINGNLASTQFISHIFHYGLGDIDTSLDKIKDTPIEDYSTATVVRQESYTNTLDDYLIRIRPDASQLGITPPIGNCMHVLSSNVKTDKGVRLLNNTDPSTNVVTNNIARRTAPKNTVRCEISVQVHGIAQNDATGELVANAVNFELYSIPFVQSHILFLNSPLGSTPGNNKVVNTEQLTPVQLTYCFEDLDPNIRYEFYARKVSLDAEETGETNTVEILHYSYFVEDDTDYCGENRLAILLAGTDSLNGQISQINSLVEAKCWKYDNGSYSWDFSRNPADWFLFTLLGIFKNTTANFDVETFPNNSPTNGWTTGIHPDNTEKLFGAGLPIEKIDLDGIMEWAQWCIDNNLNYDNVLMETLNIAESLEIIANGGRATVSYHSGKVGVVYESQDDVPTAMFGMGNIIKDSFNITYDTYDIPSEIIGVFTDRNDEWASKQVRARVPYSDNDSLNTVEVVLTGITEESRAQREINLASYRKYYQRSSYGWKTSIEGLVVQRADLIYLSHDLTCFSHSTRVFEFEISGANVSRINLGDCKIEDGSNMLLLRTIDGVINNYEVTVEQDGWVSLVDSMPASDASYYINERGDENSLASYGDTYPSDILVFVGIGNDIGKILRVISVEPGDNNTEVSITAVPEDPIIWTAEFNHIDNPAELNPDVLRIPAFIKNATYEQIGDKIFLQVEHSGATGFTVNNSDTGNPILNNDVSHSFGGNNNCISLPKGTHRLTITPFNQYTPYSAEDYELTVVVE